MVYISKFTKQQSKAVDNFLEKNQKPKPAPRDMNLYHMQQIVNKAKRGEKL